MSISTVNSTTENAPISPFLPLDRRNFENLERHRVRKLDRYAPAPIGVRKDAELFPAKNGAHAILPRGNQRQPHRRRRFL